MRGAVRVGFFFPLSELEKLKVRVGHDELYFICEYFNLDYVSSEEKEKEKSAYLLVDGLVSNVLKMVNTCEGEVNFVADC